MEEKYHNQMKKYLDQIKDVRCRIESIGVIADVMTRQRYLPIAVESVYLQFRKILEIIARASLVADQEAIKELGSSMRKLGKHNGDKLLKVMGAINPEFYPVPIVPELSGDPRLKQIFQRKTADFLTKELFAELYNKKCAPLMHAENPFGTHTNYKTLWDEVPLWKNRIMELLSMHQIHVLRLDGFFLVNMHDENDEKIDMYSIEKVNN